MEPESSFRKAFSLGVDKLARSIETIINAPEEIIADIFETSGNIIEDGLSWLANLMTTIPVIGKVIEIVLNWIGEFISGVMDLAGAIIKGVGAILSGIVCGFIHLLGGLLTITWAQIIKGSIQIVSGIAGAFIIVAGKLVIIIQAMIVVQAKKRKLTPVERQILKKVFKNSLSIYNVRLIQGKAGIFDANDRPFTLGNTIYIRNRDTTEEPELLVHECTHVWQYQNCGARYVSEALGAQWLMKDAYDWNAEIQGGNTNWVDFNRESQAEFLEDLYYYGESIEGNKEVKGNGAFFSADGKYSIGKFVFSHIDQSERANIALSKLQSNLSFRLSWFILS